MDLQFTHEERQEQLRKPHGGKAALIMEYMNKGNAILYHEIFDELHLKNNDTVLELGQGNAYLLKSILNSADNISYFGIDYSEDSIRLAKELNSDLLPSKNIQFQLGRIDQMPFQNQFFTVVFGINIIYFWDNPEKELAEIKRVMQNGSRIYFGYRPKKRMEFMPFVKSGFILYDIEEFETLLRNAGFVNIKSKIIKEIDREIDGKKFPMDCIVSSAEIEMQ